MPDITLDYGGGATTVTEGGMITANITVANAPPAGLGDDLHVKLALTMDSTANPNAGMGRDIEFVLTNSIAPGQRSSNIQIIAHSDDVFDPGEVFELSVESVWYGGRQ